MSKFKSKLARRIMAVILSGAMIMSNMSAYAAELTTSETVETIEDVIDNEDSGDTTGDDTTGGGTTGGDTTGGGTTGGDTTGGSGDTTGGDATGDGGDEGDEKPDTPEMSETPSTSDKPSTPDVPPESSEAAPPASSEVVTPPASSEVVTPPASSEAAPPASSEVVTPPESSEVVTPPASSEAESESATETESVTETESATETESETETETTTEEEVSDDEVRMIDLSDGLKKDETYGQDIVEIEVLEDMTTPEQKNPPGTSEPKIVSGMVWNTSIQGTNNPKAPGTDAEGNPADVNPNGGIPTKGAAFKIDAKEDAKIYFVTGSISNQYNFIKVDVAADGTETVVADSDAGAASAPEGTLAFTLEKDARYYFYVNGSKVKVYGIGYIAYDRDATPVAWDSVAAPSVTAAGQNATEKNRIDVTVDGVVGIKGGDKLTVEMFDKDGVLKGTAETILDKKKRAISFTPDSSGEYTFKATLSRGEGDEKQEKTGDLSAAVPFMLPLAKPVIDTITDVGSGSVEVALKSAVAEATSYKVTAYSDTACTEAVKEATGEATTADDGTVSVVVTMEGLTVGETYYFKAVAVRGENDTSEESDALAHMVAEAEEEIGTKYIFDAEKELANYERKQVIPLGTTFTDGYFILKGTGTDGDGVGDAVRGDSDTYSVQLRKCFNSYIEFTVTGTADITIMATSNSNSNTSALELRDLDGNILDSKENGQLNLIVGTSNKTTITYSGVAPGTYQIGTPEDTANNPKKYERDVRICYVEVLEMPAGLESDIDISNGLVAGQKYGNEELATLEVLEDMPASQIAEGKEIGGVTYYYSIQGKNNAKPNKGEIPTSGAAFKITAKKDTVVSFVTGAGTADRAYHVIREADQKEVLGGKTIPEGTLSFIAQADNTYYFYGDSTKIKAYAISLKEHIVIVRDDWATIANPVITSAEQVYDEKNDKNVIEVSATGKVGPKYGDALTVEMYDATVEGDEKDALVTSKISETEGDSAKFTFEPSSSGVYYFRAFLSRKAEESIEDPGEEIVFDDKSSEKTENIEFTYVLQAPLISAVTNKGTDAQGKGSIEVDWGKASEATGYKVVVTDKDGAEVGEPLITKDEIGQDGKVKEAETVGTIKNLTVGEKYKVTVQSLKTTGDNTIESKPSAAAEVTITENEQIKWSFSASGSSTSLKDAAAGVKVAGYKAGQAAPMNGYYKPTTDGNDTKDNNFDVEVWSINGAGKVVPATTDGLAFYYTEIKDDPENPKNFTLTARAHVESWKYSNGQDGFGLMVSDTVGENGNGDYVWTNCYQNVVSKVEFRWDGTKPVDDGGTRYSMKLGVGATEKIGATAQDIEDIWAGKLSQPTIWSATQYPIDYSMTHLPAGTYNIVGKCENTPEGSLEELSRVDFDLSIQKNNNGYKLSYTNVATGETTEKQFYGTDLLNQIESDKVYVGVFAGRNADVTFQNVNLRTYPASDDPEAEEQETNYINLVSTISSPTNINSSDYDLVFTSNWDGKLEVRNSDNVVIGKADVTGSLDTVKSQLEDGDNEKDTKAHVALSGLAIGDNVFTVTFTPNKNMKNQPAYTSLNSYEPVTLTHTVSYRKYGNEDSILYVAPNGKSSGTGTKANPLDVYTAIKYVQPGQKIFLAGGRYSLNKTVSIPRGMNGTADKMIYMMADPEATERPVFDFNKKVTGMTMGGNYWYFKGFDVTRSLDGQKGIQVSGSHNVLDQVNTYMNGNTGIQVSGSGNDTYKYWPQYNTILNCTSYLNADHGYEDADGFAAKLTIGSGNVFDGCIAAYNADDGWDLFAKIESGQIGSVTIKNSIAYKNGYVLVDSNGELSLKGEEVNAGNGNGFKMGGDGLPGGSIHDTVDGKEGSASYYETYKKYKGHILENSLAFENKSKGFDSNSCPNNKIKNSISFNNKGGNVELYTYNNIQETEYEVQNVISFRTKYTSVVDSVSPKGSQKVDKTAFKNESTYLWNQRPCASINEKNIRVNKSWFKSVKFEGTKESNYILFGRNENGSINRNGFMEIDAEKMKEDIESQGHTMEDTELDILNLGVMPTISKTDEELKGTSEETTGDISAGNSVITDDDNSGELYEEELKYANAHGINIVQVNDVSYTGQAVKPEIRVYLNGALFTDYSISYKNNINAYVADDENYSNVSDEKRPQMILKLKNSYMDDYIYYFDIKPVDVADNKKVAAPSIAAEKAQVPKVTLTFNGKNLALGKDFNIYTTEPGKDESGADIVVETLANKTSLSTSTTLRVKGIGNFTGTVDVPFIIVSELGLKPMSKANVKIATNAYTYTGSEILPDITVDGTEIAKSEDGKSYVSDLYDIFIANGTEVGKATVTVTAKTIVPPTAEGTETPSADSDATVTTPTAVYAGSKTVAFTIKSAPIKLDNIVFISREKNEDGSYKTSTGKGITLPDLKYTGAARAQAGEFKVVIDGVTFNGVSKGSRNVNDLDDNMLYKYNYTYEYKNNVEAGTANIVIKGIHNCTGSVALKFKINPADPVTEIKKCTKAYTETKDGNTVAVPAVKMEGKGLEIVYDYDVTYVSSGAKPTVSVYYNGNGVSKKNYSIAYKNNKNAGDSAQAIITWNGGLKGTEKTTLDYVIGKCKFEDNVYVKSISDVFTNGKTSMKASEFDKSKAVIANGKTRLSNNRDYTLEFEYDEYNSSLQLQTEPVKDAAGNETGEIKAKRVVYDTSDKNAKKNDVYVPRTGLDVAVYIKPVSGGKFDNYESVDGGRVKVADIRVAYFDIAKANIKLIDDATGKNAILYFKDVTELTTINSSGINCLDQKYVKVAHSAYAKSEYFNAEAVDKDGYLLYTKYATRLDAKKSGDGYTYDVNATDAVKAGTQKVTFYGTGLFGGSKVFRYKLEKKSYNISKAVVDTKTGIYIACDDYLAGGEITKEVKAQLEVQLAKALEGRITAVNGSLLLPGYFTCTYGKDIENCKTGKPITVTIKGANSYSGSKTVKIAATLISDDIGSASVSSVSVEAAKDAISSGVVLGNEDEPLNVALEGKINVGGYTLVYGEDFTVNDQDYIVFATDDNGEYIVDANGETRIDEDGNTITDDSGNPIKYKVLRKYTGYYNNKAVSTEEAPAYVCIKGMGKFKGVLEVAFTISEAAAQEAAN